MLKLSALPLVAETFAVLEVGYSQVLWLLGSSDAASTVLLGPTRQGLEVPQNRSSIYSPKMKMQGVMSGTGELLVKLTHTVMHTC